VRGEAESEEFVAALRPWSNGRQYLNFAENRTDVSTFFRPEQFSRLQAVRATVDPDGLMVSNHEVPAATVPQQR
jgi:hypothetical protein